MSERNRPLWGLLLILGIPAGFGVTYLTFLLDTQFVDGGLGSWAKFLAGVVSGALIGLGIMGPVLALVQWRRLRFTAGWMARGNRKRWVA